MLRQEFEGIYVSKVGHPLSIDDKDYECIEFVYNWHPCNFSKEAIVSLYAEFGMCIIYDLLPRAQMAMENDHDIELARTSLKCAQKRVDELVSKDLKTKEVLQEWLQN